MYYVFDSETGFSKHKSKTSALYIARLRSGVVFQKVKGIPNPWFCYLLDTEGRKVSKEYMKPSEMDECLKKHFKKSSSKC